jgi:hypothetical protein
MEYLIVSEYTIENCMSSVNDLIKLGWKPIGGICFSATPEGLFNNKFIQYLQAMTREG